jgi:hypothetical protein
VRLIPRRGPKRKPLIRPEDILLSKRITWRIDEPFTIFECDRLFSEDVYQRLIAEFPVERLRSKFSSGRLRVRIDEAGNPREFGDLLRGAPTWAACHRAFRSRVFVRDFRRLFRDSLDRRARPKWRGVAHVARMLGLPLSSVKFDFVMSRRGYHLSPHTDARNKLVAMMLYLPSAGRDPAQQAMGTLFWSPRPDSDQGTHVEKGPMTSRSLPRVLSEGESGDVAVENFLSRASLAASTAYRENSLAGFVKARNSWHSVDLRSIPDGAERCTVLINVNAVGVPELLAGIMRRSSFLSRLMRSAPAEAY